MLVCHGEDEETSGSVEHLLVYWISSSRLSQCRAFVSATRVLFCFFLFTSDRPLSLRPWRKLHTRTCASVGIDANDDVRLPAFDPLPHLILGFFNFICKNIFLHTSERWSLDCREESCDTSEGSVCFVLRTFFRFVFFCFVFFFAFQFSTCQSMIVQSSRSAAAARPSTRWPPGWKHFRSLLTLASGVSKQTAHSPLFFSWVVIKKVWNGRKKKILSFDLLRSLCLCLCLFCSYMTTLNVAQRIETEVTSFEPPVVYFQYVLKVTHKHCTITAEHVHSNL